MEHELDSPSQSEESTQQLSVSNHESDPKNDIVPQDMKIQRNSIPDTNPSSIVKSSLTEHYFQNRAIDQWDGPKYETYGSKELRLRSFIITIGLMS